MVRTGENQASALQKRTLLCFLAMMQESRSWRGRLLMLGAVSESAPFALAAMAAGGAVLALYEDEEALSEGGRLGYTDFQVTGFTEALRILKNEIRRGRPVSVGFSDSAGTAWDKAVHRGVQPDALLADARHREAAQVLVGRGAKPLHTAADAHLREHLAGTWRERKAGDQVLRTAALKMQADERVEALQWLDSAPRLFPRDLHRWLAACWQLHPTERDAGNTAG